MAFQFPLDMLLRFRRSLEHQRELALGEANQRVVSTEQKIAEVDRVIVNLLSRENREMESGLTAAQLRFDVLCRNALEDSRHDLETVLEQCKELRERCRKDYQKAHQDREVVETLREQQLQIFRRNAEKQEQRQLDDMFLLRREYLRRG